MRPMRSMLVGCGAVLALVAAPLGAQADVGALTPLGASNGVGLVGAWDVAVSADGKSVYVVGNGDDTIVFFKRDPSTGSLTWKECIADAGDAAGCGQDQTGLNGAIGVAVTPDGKSVYVASEKDHAVVRFNRAPDGTLTPAGCIADAGDPSTTGCGATQEGLEGANDIAANNKSVYVVSRNDHAIVHFDRPNIEPVTGEISPQGCIDDVSGPAACAGEQEGLLDAQAVTISPDGKSVYVVSREEDAIVRFARTEAGSISGQGCISDPVGGVDCGVGNTQQGLGGARDVAVSADGKSVYVAGQGDSAIARFNRDVNGGLSPQGCVEDAGGSAGCGVTQEGLQQAYGVAVSPDGLSVYVVGSTDHAIARFDRGADGALTPRGFTTTVGLGFPHRIAVSPDSTSVYVPGSGSNNVVCYFRATATDSVPPTITPPATPPTPPRRIPPRNVIDIENVFAPKRTVTFDVNLPGGGTILVHATGEVTGPPRFQPQPYASFARTNSKTITIARKQATAKRAGRLRIKLTPRRKAKLYLERDGKLKAKVKLTFTPTGGTPGSVTRKVTFRLEKRR